MNMNKKIKVVVTVEGGVIQGAYSNDPNVDLAVWDWDEKEEQSSESDMELLSDKFEKLTEGFSDIWPKE
jgi:hypothetical protein